MSDRIIKTISVPRGGKVDKFFQDAKRAGKNISGLVCGIIERHSTLYDDNVQMELELNELKYRYGRVCNAARDALARGGEKWELYFPPELSHIGPRDGENYGLASRIHFRRVDVRVENADQSNIDS
jgi:hypothetical protein